MKPSPLATQAARMLAGWLAFTAMATCPPVVAQDLHGAGATFAAPLYDAWGEAYQRSTGIALRYDPIGSSLGARLIEQRQVDFGTSDAPLGAERLARGRLRQFPAVIGAVVPVVNITGIAPGQLVLDASLLSAIYRGRIRNWRNPAIVARNPGLALPDANITVVHRADGSGTTYLWSRYLSQGDAAWRDEVGAGTTLAWPIGAEGLGNEGVASLVQRTRAAIGYVAFAYARAHHLSDVALPSKDGPVVRADRSSFEAAVAAAPWRTPADLEQDLGDEPGSTSWPIVGASFFLVPDADPDAHGQAGQGAVPGPRRALTFLDWAITAGAPLARDLDYVPLPPAAVTLIEQSLPR